MLRLGRSLGRLLGRLLGRFLGRAVMWYFQALVRVGYTPGVAGVREPA